jgi:hypothetical protein
MLNRPCGKNRPFHRFPLLGKKRSHDRLPLACGSPQWMAVFPAFSRRRFANWLGWLGLKGPAWQPAEKPGNPCENGETAQLRCEAKRSAAALCSPAPRSRSGSRPARRCADPQVGRQPGWQLVKGDFRAIRLSNDTHCSSTDPDAWSARQSIAHRARPSCRGRVLMDKRHDLILDCRVTPAMGT